MNQDYSPQIPDLTPAAMKNEGVLRRLVNHLRSLTLFAGEGIKISRQGYGTTISVDTVASGGGGGGGTTVLPATISNVTGTAPDFVHIAYMYGHGYEENPTEIDVTLDSIMNLSVNYSLSIGTKLSVITAGEERIGQVNGIF